MIDLKQASENALAFVEKIYPENGDFQVEEIETTEDGKYWLITIGMYDFKDVKGTLAALVTKPRKYKSVQIDKENGDVISMKIRKI